MPTRRPPFFFFLRSLGGTAGAIATCPLEVVKTRLQSSVANFHFLSSGPGGSPAAVQSLAERLGLNACTCTPTPTGGSGGFTTSVINANNTRAPSIGIWRCLKQIVEMEGTKALFKGLGPNLVGVAPSRAIYFCTYSNSKSIFNELLPSDTPIVHICSAASAGFMSCTATNPIWFVKTRLQLDQRMYGSISALQCIRDIYQRHGLLGFYKGITASYFGISETIIHFVIYEFIKAQLRQRKESSRDSYNPDVKSTRDFVQFMAAGAVSKTCASTLAYPHVLRRSHSAGYRGFACAVTSPGLKRTAPSRTRLLNGCAGRVTERIPLGGIELLDLGSRVEGVFNDPPSPAHFQASDLGLPSPVTQQPCRASSFRLCSCSAERFFNEESEEKSAELLLSFKRSHRHGYARAKGNGR
ncbi:hypothetical protein HPB51_009220 [Rhipicephalus microplus]|uniref:Mitochondrial carrier protein n=1 Tax=Rhipicephalus microplus TaxID=6941 RepID=A0A9J6F0K9_RHIMP|nr:hypothetical protein HPB51_009220 [Rhipicephalus microplus]